MHSQHHHNLHPNQKPPPLIDLTSPITPSAATSSSCSTPTAVKTTMSHSPLPVPPPLALPPSFPSLPTPIHPPVSPPSRPPVSRFTSPTIATPPPAPPLLLPDDATFTSSTSYLPRRRPRLPALSPSPRLPSALPPSASPRVLRSPRTTHLPYFNSTDLTPPPPPSLSQGTPIVTPKKRMLYRFAKDNSSLDESEADSLFSTLPVKRPRPLPSPSELYYQRRNGHSQMHSPAASPPSSFDTNKGPSVSSNVPFVPLAIPPGVLTGPHSAKPPKNPFSSSPANTGYKVVQRSPGLLTSTTNAMAGATGNNAGAGMSLSPRMGLVMQNPDSRPSITGGSSANNGHCLSRGSEKLLKDGNDSRGVVTREIDCSVIRRQGYGEFVEHHPVQPERQRQQPQQQQHLEQEHEQEQSQQRSNEQLQVQKQHQAGNNTDSGAYVSHGMGSVPTRERDASCPPLKHEEEQEPVTISKIKLTAVDFKSEHSHQSELEDTALQRLGEVENDPLLCGVCGARFARKSNRLKHVRSVHTTERRFKCNICSYAFKRQDHLHKHIASVHEKRRNFKCTICQAAFAEKFNLKKHIKTVHFKHSGLPALAVNERTAMAMKFLPVHPQM